MSRLTIRRGPQPGKVFELMGDVITIGSGSKNTISILDNDVSREHCKLVRSSAGYELHDLDSRRGTFVSGLRVKNGWVLRTGNIIELGENVTLEYLADPTGTDQLAANPGTPASPPVVTGGGLLRNLQLSSDRPDPAKTPWLVVMDGDKAGQRFPLKNPAITIGRDLTNDIVLADAEISRTHVRLKWADTDYLLEDTGSTNGTEVNGTRLPAKSPVKLKPDDKVSISGRVDLLYTYQPDSPGLPSRQEKSQPIPPAAPTLRQTSTAESPAAIKPTSRLGTGLKPGALNDHILIAYTRDMWEPVVARMMVALQDARQKPWVDQYLNEGSEDWMAAVDQAFAECWMGIIIVSKPALESKYIQAAFRYFYSRKKPLVLYMVDRPASLPPELASAKAVRHEPLNPTYSFDELIIEVKSRKRG
ncbi:MAG TPA: FHA domain-containing protein [Aggregatilineales bacterium]|nr:FHA domain-containing protein [Aggregatilineales bacterium]